MEWNVRKLKATITGTETVVYEDPSSPDSKSTLNERIGQKISLEFKDSIQCIACERPINKTFAQGYCFPCMQSLASCDQCIIKPELCHHHLGTCREPEWGEKNCMIPHSVYLSVTSGIKVGVTRAHQKLTRWIDQGATAAVEVGQTAKRLNAGLIESNLKRVFADKTNWRAMLKGSHTADELEKKIDLFWEEIDQTEFSELIEESPTKIQRLQFPVETYPEKIKSIGFDKQKIISGTLKGIKGQYLYIGDVVMNVRKHQGYIVDWNWS